MMMLMLSVYVYVCVPVSVDFVVLQYFCILTGVKVM